MRIHRLTVCGLVAPLLLGAAPAAAGLDAVSLSAAPPSVTYGEPATLAGSLQASPACLGGRAVRIERLAGDWQIFAETATGADGAFSAQVTPEATAAYRAVLPGELRTEPCEEAVSTQVAVGVHAAVSLSPPGSLRAGRCRVVKVTVAPPKPGQAVEVQRGGAGGWATVGEGTLDAAGAGKVPVCATWADLGALTLRARWPVQDVDTLEGASASTVVTVAKARWMRRIDALTAGLPIGVAVREGGAVLYRRADGVRRVPASNEKLLLSMALLDTFGPDATLPTIVAARAVKGGRVRGDLWILGRGDPATGRPDLRRLARAIHDAGVRSVRGSVRGSTGYFSRDWWAPGWKRSFPGTFVNLPTALTYERNPSNLPELRAADALTRFLRLRGVAVRGAPGAGPAPGGLGEVARVERPLAGVLGTMNRESSNFFAEVLAKRLGAERIGTPGSIAKGARAIRLWAASQGVGVRAHDGSGLSYANRAAPRGLVTLLELADGTPWGEILRGSLPAGGEGTLEHRLGSVPVRAKTGTLTSISALSGWVLAERTDSWVEFSIMATGMPVSPAKRIEDRIVRLLWRNAA